MDVLSEVLKAVKLQGAIFFNAEFSSPWCFKSASAKECTPHLAPGAERLILFHFLTEGRAFARLSDGGRVQLAAGDIIVLPHGDEHYLGNGSPERPVDSMKVFAKNLAEGLKIVRWGGGGETTKFVCGFLACDYRLSESLLSGLPPLLKVKVAQGPSGEWLANSIRFSVGDSDGAGAGSGLVIARLSEVLFAETLRRYIGSLPASDTGWLAGARDPVVGQALAHLHKAPDHPWTIDSLARRVGLSRTLLAERFRHYLGESPMAYLANWRLNLGAELLQSSDESVAQIAADVGYGSEAAFNRAFKKRFDCPPAQFRRNRKSTGARS